MIKLSAFKHIYGMMYTDRFSAYEHKPVVDHGITTNKLEEVPVYDKVPCRISYTESDNSRTDLEDRNPTSQFVTIFTSPDNPIKKGYLIVAERLDDDGHVIETIRAYAGKPFSYVTHQQVILVDERDA